MRRRGWFRLWVVATLIGVPAATLWTVIDNEKTWEAIDQVTIQQCISGI